MSAEASPTPSRSSKRDKQKKKKPPITKRSFPYFEDGNIVISANAENKDRLLFRLHQSVLSFHSTVFADMFTLPPPAESTGIDMHDGVPLVHLPDPATRVASLLKLMYNPTSFHFNRYDRNLPSVIEHMMRLCGKYQIDGLLGYLKGLIESAWPKTLVEWDTLETEIDLKLDFRRYGESLDDFIDDQYPEPASAIVLAREFDITSILPAAFYHLSRLDTEMDDKKNRGDYDDTFMSRLGEGQRAANWGCLSSSDLLSLIRGRERIKTLYTDIPTSINRSRAFSDCVNKESETACSSISWSLAKDLRDQTEGDLLNHLKTVYSSSALEKSGMCWSCRYSLGEAVKVVRADLWEQIGPIFLQEEFDSPWGR
ncbi:hypothetical protein JAAARDRAFT_177480 [Jaapia argillacea MUCL 33604]|uniref:BTB domain-containing protein n=1 Tax=Jaapia argillacea MUCL 33604 TaxID=933084 RepID=A0A067PTZ4_9AGAM|nr:hypothetical protein JAAARDRAFT_177480 [Jaapia argillacea MUCL 33604]